MNRVTAGLLGAGAILLPLGWILVFASGYGGDSAGGSEIVWRIGGLMVYAAVPLLLLAAMTYVGSLISAVARRRRAASR